MTDKELCEDLKNNINHINYLFKTKLFKRDVTIFSRRTFDDLFLYYRRYGITEKQLMKGLVDSDFGALYCDTVKKFTWSKNSQKGKHIKFWHSFISEQYLRNYGSSAENTKYTRVYLEKLYDEVKNDKNKLK